MSASEHDDVVRAALARLVALKDGPRDEAYEREKGRAWSAARRALAAAAPPPAGPQVDREALVTAARTAILEAHGPGPGPEHDCCTYADMYAARATDAVVAVLAPLLGNRQTDPDALAARLREAFPAREFLWREGDTFGRLTPETLADLLAKVINDG